MGEPRNRYEYDLLDLCGRIHGSVSGSGDGIPHTEAVRLHAWLSWRIAEGWMRTNAHHWFFEDSVRMLCRAALDELAAEIGAMDEQERFEDGGPS